MQECACKKTQVLETEDDFSQYLWEEFVGPTQDDISR